jgi:hypothetical protein
MGRSAKKFFKKIKNRLCQRLLPGALGTGFFQNTIEKQSLQMTFSRGSRRNIFSKKMENCLRRRPASGSRHGFSKKYKQNPLCRRPSREAVGKEDFKKPSS